MVLSSPVNCGISSASVADNRNGVQVGQLSYDSRHLFLEAKLQAFVKFIDYQSCDRICIKILFGKMIIIRPGVPMITDGCTPLMVRCSSMAGRPP